MQAGSPGMYYSAKLLGREANSSAVSAKGQQRDLQTAQDQLACSLGGKGSKAKGQWAGMCGRRSPYLKRGLPGDEAKGKLPMPGMPDDDALAEGLRGLIAGVDCCADLLGCGVHMLHQRELLDDPLPQRQEQAAQVG